MFVDLIYLGLSTDIPFWELSKTLPQSSPAFSEIITVSDKPLLFFNAYLGTYVMVRPHAPCP